ncbi:putative P450 monooxygenase [Phyllosticta capitalensis]|uniref:P450 monooxygenase n=1 Tax=Phyllosticta capitalensis TaxID=121624 RepID=A0ABR1YKC9_9PEZI
MAAQPLLACGAASLAGAASWAGYFHKGEHHLYPLRYVQGLIASFLLGTFLVARIDQTSFSHAASIMTAITASYLAGVYACLITWRLFLSPLNKFPGPFMARLSSFWMTFHVGNSEAYKLVTKLHQQHGDFVRVGSNDLSILDPDAVPVIYGFGTKCFKSPWYDNDYPLSSMHSTRNRQYHDTRRRVWSISFSDKALRGYEPRVQKYASILVRQLQSFSGQPVDATEWFNYFAYDVMGELAFGKSFGTLERGQEHYAIELLGEGLQAMAYMMPTWFFRCLTNTPLAKPYWRFINYCSDQSEERMKNKPDVPDIMSPLLDQFSDKKNLSAEEKGRLHGDARLIIVAGSDTTSATLIHAFYHLALEPQHIDKLREEINPKIQPDGSINHRDIQDLPHLNGVINEALRLHPPVPTALQRTTPPEGIEINGTYIPGNMNVWVPQWALARSEKAYAEPHRFLPERWYEKKEMVKKEKAFFPFSTGVFGCIGKPLALMELRLVIAKLLVAFDIAFAPGETGDDLLNKTRDHFTIECGGLKLVFKERNAV